MFIRTDETLLNELILGRPTSEIRLLTEAFRQKHGETNGNLIKEVKGDLSLDTARSE
jgi:annexin A7/11